MTGNSTAKRIISIAKKYGFTLVRRKNHFVFRNNNGIQLITAASPSDHRAAKNIESIIKKLLKNHDSNHTD